MPTWNRPRAVERLVVSPGAATSFDGKRRWTPVVVRTENPRERWTHPDLASAVDAAVEVVAASPPERVAFRGRAWLARQFSPAAVVRAEVALADAASRRGIRLVVSDGSGGAA